VCIYGSVLASVSPGRGDEGPAVRRGVLAGMGGWCTDGVWKRTKLYGRYVPLPL